MLHNLALGVPVMLACLLLQAVFVAVCLRYYARFKHARHGHFSLGQEILLLSVVMVLTLSGNFVQMAIWAILFMLLGEFADFATALYHSGVNFATLGYGDIVMSPAWRLLGPLEAANGILMFGVSSSVMTAAVLEVIKQNLASLGEDVEP
ncbi:MULTISPECIES: potassium channel family protein [Cupriavidus]|uniref:Membrane lipoprotein n=1 Tax=Cupriavidus taiwanensis TaxID=164546 RepID=A0A375CVN3_9BURK|nr:MULTISPECIES: potassium channel family protein [Cupriavidus]MEC3769006.1 potassium channel family protein [Cupriavidus sp. SS-3]SOY79848.1 putative membrane lipoprotein [Cupriavidus taiwanensis]SOY81815.1 putative membrane lipoprotein [Cupriavidus taiwanensis]SPD65057.1 putative membrane lipoprotein [Cupriavidus taiwanensis]